MNSQAEKWQENFRFVDVWGELTRLEAFFSSKAPKEKMWTKEGAFAACANALQKANQRQMQEYQKKDPNFDPNDPDGSKQARKELDKTMEMLKDKTDPYRNIQ